MSEFLIGVEAELEVVELEGEEWSAYQASLHLLFGIDGLGWLL